MKRNLYNELLERIDKKEFVIISGARQVGKSTLMRQLAETVKGRRGNVVFLNLENRSILDDLNASPLNLLGYAAGMDGRVTVFIDEIQYLADPANFLKLIYDEYADRIKIVATGSSAFYLDRKFRDSLAGRKRIFHLQTCLFDEYLRLRGADDLTAEYERIRTVPGAKSAALPRLQTEFMNYLRFGGYPAVVTERSESEKIALLRDLRDSFVKRDIIESGVVNDRAFYTLLRFLAGQQGDLLNVSGISAALGIQKATTDRHLDVMRKCFHIRLVTPFYRNIRRELTRMPKVYVADNGMRNCLLNNFPTAENTVELGKAWETEVLRMLSAQAEEDEIKFWRTQDGNEIDFVVDSPTWKAAVEVKVNAAKTREGKYARFIAAYPDWPFVFARLLPFDTASLCGVFRKQGT